MWIDFLLPLRFIDPDQFLPLPRVLAEAIVSDSVKPGRKFGLPAKAADVLVSANERFLREIIGQGEIAARELT